MRTFPSECTVLDIFLNSGEVRQDEIVTINFMEGLPVYSLSWQWHQTIPKVLKSNPVPKVVFSNSSDYFIPFLSVFI
jgi:hypothetical protein